MELVKKNKHQKKILKKMLWTKIVIDDFKFRFQLFYNYLFIIYYDEDFVK